MHILLVSHEGVASGMKKSVDMITGKQEGIYAIELTEEGVELFSTALHTFLDDWKRFRKPLIILADLKGGTPYNQAVAIVHQLNLEENVFVISGVNLPIILASIFIDEDSFRVSDLDCVMESSRDAIFKARPLELSNNDMDE